jgi:hypothetical protein
MDRPLPSEVVAAVISSEGKLLGTAFFVSRTTAITCAHVVGDRDRSQIRLSPVGGPDLLDVQGLRVADQDDLARLEISPRGGRAWLPLNTKWGLGARVVSHGFSKRYPVGRFPSGHPTRVTEISGQTVVEWKNHRSEVLTLAESDADNGLSGGPVVETASRTAIGVLRFRHMAEGGNYAIPAEVIIRNWPDLPSIGEEGSLTAIPSSGSGTRTGWLAFEDAKLHCVVVDSETCRAIETGRLLSDAMRRLLSSATSSDIWDAFRHYWKDRLLLGSHSQRKIPELSSKSNIPLAILNVESVYEDRPRLAEAVRLVVESDVALFDVTNFEPGIMLLMGIRAASRRGITIASHGQWREGELLSRPFNLSDLSLATHLSSEVRVGKDTTVERLGDRIVTGFGQMANVPAYLDMPAHDGIRSLGYSLDSWSTIGLDALALVLCSYSKEFYDNWLNLQLQVQESLSDYDLYPEVSRLQDLPNPQLVSQALYEKIRRCSACIADWTGWSPSTFFELGVRLAISPWGAIQIVDDQWIDDRLNSTAPGDSVTRLEQVKFMREIFSPISYRGKSDGRLGESIARDLLATRSSAGVQGGHYIRSVVRDAVPRIQEARADISIQLAREADSLHHGMQTQINTPQALFYEVKEIKEEQEAMALQRRIAAWLYLDYRVGAADLGDDDPRKKEWYDLGSLVIKALYTPPVSDEDAEFAEHVENRLGL